MDQRCKQRAALATKQSVNVQFPILNSHRIRIGNRELNVNGFLLAFCGYIIEQDWLVLDSAHDAP